MANAGHNCPIFRSTIRKTSNTPTTRHGRIFNTAKAVATRRTGNVRNINLGFSLAPIIIRLSQSTCPEAPARRPKLTPWQDRQPAFVKGSRWREAIHVSGMHGKGQETRVTHVNSRGQPGGQGVTSQLRKTRSTNTVDTAWRWKNDVFHTESKAIDNTLLHVPRQCCPLWTSAYVIASDRCYRRQRRCSYKNVMVCAVNSRPTSKV